ncbi:MAG: hypothetical protein GY807_13825 [Gammaproteobacteria bacterium]|nr:hypothetical protein [Gammaproteobacteria bacterium]
MSERRLIVVVLMAAFVLMATVRASIVVFDWYNCDMYQEATGRDTIFKLPSSCFVLRDDEWRLLGECGE